MNYITLAMLGLTAVPIVFGALLGLMRGSRRALLRLILIVVCVVLAFVLRGAVTDKLINTEVPALGGSVLEYLQESIFNSMPESLSEFIVPIMQSILQVIVFLLLFFLLWLLTWIIVYPICKIFVKPKRVENADGERVKRKHPLIGAVIGIVQGAIVALCVCVVLNGLLLQVNNIMTAADDLSNVSNNEAQAQAMDYDVDYNEDYDVENSSESDGGSAMDSNVLGLFGEYADSSIGKLYSGIGSKPFDLISQVKLEDGRKITLSGQIDAIKGLANMAKELMNLQNIDFGKLLTEGNITALQDIFNKLGEINDNLSDEAKETINDLITSVAKEMLGDDLGVDFSGLDITGVDFKKEGEIFTRLYEYNNKEVSVDDAQDIIDNMVQSDIILDVLKNQDNVNLTSQLETSEHRETIVGIINEYEARDDVPQEKIDALRKIFGLQQNS